VSPARRWAPAALLAVGALLATVGVKAQRSLALRVPLAEAVPAEINGLHSQNVTISPAELKAVGVTSYLARNYQGTDTAKAAAFSLYVGYYAQQTQGQTIHSPKNCLPGAGWEPLKSESQQVETADGTVTVNRYLIQNGQQQALVFYWYQGRGRVAWNEFRVKWDLLRDAAIRRRSDEALVRIVVPVHGSETDALQTARAAAAIIVPALHKTLPA
jgi:EpsI family protein